jgi:hypothetical protein
MRKPTEKWGTERFFEKRGVGVGSGELFSWSDRLGRPRASQRPIRRVFRRVRKRVRIHDTRRGEVAPGLALNPIVREEKKRIIVKLFNQFNLASGGLR